MKKLGIEIRLNTEVKDLSSLGVEEVVIATGASAKKLPIKGFEKAIEAIDFLNGTPVGDKVAVIGGGLTGSEIAYELSLDGKHPFIVEGKDDLIKQSGVCMANSTYLREYFQLHGVPVYLESTIAEIKDGEVVIKTKEGEKMVPADSVISAIGYNPKPLAKGGRHVHLVGDCIAPGNLRTVIWRAYEVAMKI